MKSKRVFAIICVCFALVLAGCKEVKDVSYETVDVTVVSKFHRASYVTPMNVGKMVLMQTHPATYEITVLYDGKTYTVSGSDVYKRYEDKVGEETSGTLKTTTYEDDTVGYDIIDLK